MITPPKISRTDHVTRAQPSPVEEDREMQHLPLLITFTAPNPKITRTISEGSGKELDISLTRRGSGLYDKFAERSNR